MSCTQVESKSERVYFQYSFCNKMLPDRVSLFQMIFFYDDITAALMFMLDFTAVDDSYMLLGSFI